MLFLTLWLIYSSNNHNVMAFLSACFLLCFPLCRVVFPTIFCFLFCFCFFFFFHPCDNYSKASSLIMLYLTSRILWKIYIKIYLANNFLTRENAKREQIYSIGRLTFSPRYVKLPAYMLSYLPTHGDSVKGEGGWRFGRREWGAGWTKQLGERRVRTCPINELAHRTLWFITSFFHQVCFTI